MRTVVWIYTNFVEIVRTERILVSSIIIITIIIGPYRVIWIIIICMWALRTRSSWFTFKFILLCKRGESPDGRAMRIIWIDWAFRLIIRTLYKTSPWNIISAVFILFQIKSRIQSESNFFLFLLYRIQTVAHWIKSIIFIYSIIIRWVIANTAVAPIAIIISIDSLSTGCCCRKGWWSTAMSISYIIIMIIT